jgi:nucleotide-binding universal stress UspA family protein
VAFQHQIDSGRIHCELGSVNRVVNYTSQQIDAGVIVLGSTMRAGVSRSLGGSVAEAVMAETDSDVLIVKSGRESLSITV